MEIGPNGLRLKEKKIVILFNILLLGNNEAILGML